jgi:hypothetical protein
VEHIRYAASAPIDPAQTPCEISPFKIAITKPTNGRRADMFAA